MLNVDACDPGSADRHPMTSNGAPLWDVAENLKRDNWSAFYQLIGNPQKFWAVSPVRPPSSGMVHVRVRFLHKPASLDYRAG